MREAVQAGLSGRYEVGAELGRGGMAVVYAASDLQHRRPVALKVLLPEVAAVLGIERFLREIQTTARLSHPHIVPVFDSGVLDLGLSGRQTPWFAMPLMAGASLRDRLDRHGQLPLEETIGICRDVGGALAYAHAQGVLHRDVKPENILLSSDQALLTDFGIARPMQREREGLTSAGFLLGTPAYMSPEQRAGDPAVDARADQYALAAVLYEMLAGEAPFGGRTPQAVVARQLAGELLPLRTVRPSVPEAIDAAVRKALAPAPADRFPSVEAFLEALALPAPAARSRRGRRAALAVAALIVVTTLVALWRISRPVPVSDGRLGVALMPFLTIGDDSRGWGEALPDLLATTLSGTPGLRIPDPWSLWRGLRPERSAPARSPDLQEAERLARRVRAHRLVMGSLVQAGERLELAIRIYALGSGEPMSTFTLSEPADSAVTLARRAALELMQRLAPEGRAALGSPTTVTESPDALKAYLAAREAFRRGLVDSADASITRAITLDSLFALALVEAVIIRTWAQSSRGVPYGGLRALIRRGLALKDQLPERQHLRLQTMEASVATDGPRAAAAFRRIIELDSTDVEAWNGLSYVSMVYGWMFGVSPEDVVEITDRVLALDSTYMVALFRRAQLSPALADTGDARRMADRLRMHEGVSPVLRGSRRGLEALLASDAEFATMADSLSQAPVIEWSGVVRRLRAYQPDRALALAGRRRRESPPGPGFTTAAYVEATLLAAVGQYRMMDSIRGSGAWSPAEGLEAQADWRVLYHASIGLGDSATTRAALGRMTAAWPADSALAWLDRTPVWQTGWILAAYHASVGEPSVARRWLGNMSAYPRGGSPLEWAAALRADVESRLAERAGQLDSAAALTRRAFELWTIHTENISDIDPEPALRFRLAESVSRQGLLDSAAILYQSLAPPATWMSAITTRSLYELGVLAERQGDRARAVAWFDQALRYWELGGPEIAVWRDRAREGVRRNAAGG